MATFLLEGMGLQFFFVKFDGSDAWTEGIS